MVGFLKKRIWGLPLWWPLFLLGLGFSLFLASHFQLTIFPNSGDESAVLFQAQNFSKAKLGLEVETVSSHSFASHYTFIKQGVIYGEYPPLPSLLLTPGVWLGWPLLSQVLQALVALTLLGWLFFRIGFDLQASFLMAAFLGLSPSFFFHASSYYTHIPQFLLTMLAFHVYLSFHERGLLKDIFYLGVVIGLGALVRPYTAFILALAFLPWCLSLIFLKNGSWRFLFVGLGATLLGASGLFVWNYLLSGDAFELVFFKAGGNDQYLGFNVLFERGIEDHLLQWHSYGKWLFGLGFSPVMNLYDGFKTWQHFGLIFFLGSVAGNAYYARKAYLCGELRKFWGPAFTFLFLIIFLHLFYVSIGGRFGERYYFEAGFLFLLPYLSWLLSGQKRWKLYLFSGWALYFCLLNYSTSVALKRKNTDLFAPYLLARDVLKMSETRHIIFLKSTPHHDPHFYAGPAPWNSHILFAVDPSHWAEELGQEWVQQHRAQIVERLGSDYYDTYQFEPRGPIRGELKRWSIKE